MTCASSQPYKDEPKVRDLDGLTISYLYSNGYSYAIKFEPAGVSFRQLHGEGGEWIGKYEYEAFKIRRNMYMVAWFESGEYNNYVTLLVDLDNETVYGSAYYLNSDGGTTMFHSAKLLTKTR